ncbi:MAG: hypothetical protein DKINENOH_01722 [bacterium]|nr:hypothetical protein [bacterium]
MTVDNYTHHVMRRMNARRISQVAFDVAMQYGRKIYAPNSLYYFLGHKELQHIPWLAPGEREHFEGITIVCDPRSQMALTCFKNKGFTRRIRGRK